MPSRPKYYERADPDRIVKICHNLEIGNDRYSIIKREAADLIRELAQRIVLLENELYDEVSRKD